MFHVLDPRQIRHMHQAVNALFNLQKRPEIGEFSHTRIFKGHSKAGSAAAAAAAADKKASPTPAASAP